MNIQNFKDQPTFSKFLLIVTYPLAIAIHFQEWRRMKHLQKNIRKWLPKALSNPNGIHAETVSEWSRELRDIYGK